MSKVERLAKLHEEHDHLLKELKWRWPEDSNEDTDPKKAVVAWFDKDGSLRINSNVPVVALNSFCNWLDKCTGRDVREA